MIVLINFSSSLNLPFHVRYQPPQLNGGYSNIPFLPPIIIAAVAPECSYTAIPETIKYLLPAEIQHSCFHITQLEGAIFSVPVGDASMEVFISQATSFAAFLGVFLVFIALYFKSFPKLRNKMKND